VATGGSGPRRGSGLDGGCAKTLPTLQAQKSAQTTSDARVRREPRPPRTGSKSRTLCFKTFSLTTTHLD
jgi:hypothetical protein